MRKIICCCKQMQKAIDTKNEVAINFEDTQKFFAIDKSCDPDDLYQVKIKYCPFCGAKLPSLRLRYWKEMKKSYPELNNACNGRRLTMDDDIIPKEFRSGDWWRRRYL